MGSLFFLIVKTVHNLFSRLCDPDHLDRAVDATVRGKRRHPDVAWFLFRREDEVERLRQELESDDYRPGLVELVIVRDPKLRLIARMPIADRVVQTALVHLMEPVFARGLLPAAFACRPGLGTHRAVLKLLELVRRHRFALHLDIKTYFPSIDLDILHALLARRIGDARFLAVLDRLLEAGARIYRRPQARAAACLAGDWPPPGRGLPIGAYTSQLFAAHVYLDEFDHFVKRELKVPGYVRYVDDMFFFGDRRGDLRLWRREVAQWLRDRRGLRLKHPEARILACHGHLDALGYRIRRQGLEALPRALNRFRRRIRSELLRPRNHRPQVDLERSIASTAGVVLF